MKTFILDLIYIVSAFAFIVGIKMLGKPVSAKRGNLLAAAGMTAAIFGTIFLNESVMPTNYVWIFGALILGSAVGYVMAKKVQMTQMPQMVSFFNGMGGACAALISIVEFDHYIHHPGTGSVAHLVILLLGMIIGAVSFSGSMIAYGKLEEKIKDFRLPAQQVVNILVLLVIFGLIYAFSAGIVVNPLTIYIILGLAAAYGLLFVFPIGGADMPVVISLLNSFTGVATAFGGFLYDNKVMLFGGILVGSAGTLLTVVMCRAMNRSLANVLIGNFGGKAAASSGRAVTGTIKEISAADTAALMKYSKNVVIVPGYGLAVAQAQHVCHELELSLEAEGAQVKYAIHPVAGRMPGHMNVLLAESNVDYDKLLEMDDINPEFKTTDVVLVVGANDVVNPAAKNDPASPIYGMPILDVEDAANVIVMKRSMRAGYAGIENELFFNPKTRMLFGDAKKMMQELVNELKNA
ncbi:NAD(P)(+) transhydrogenase (Re/Si-specific) subunit beta [Ignavibacteria bacterium]|nr:NAD(P)(+) transhydrogenase (Re/Si-specific) subunit beta [Bacteroidota bacterium]MCZ2132393.1 NAD(P)(+) transhydrogenase (Re/Si-specific) subunit beta [Bacteroidota bacterium]